MAKKKNTEPKVLKEITGNIPFTIRFDEAGELKFKLDGKTTMEQKFIALSMVGMELIAMLKALEAVMPKSVKEELETTLTVIQDTLRAASKKLKRDHGLTSPEAEKEDLIKTLSIILKRELGDNNIKIEQISEDDLKKLLANKEDEPSKEEKPKKRVAVKKKPIKDDDDIVL